MMMMMMMIVVVVIAVNTKWRHISKIDLLQK